MVVHLRVRFYPVIMAVLMATPIVAIGQSPFTPASRVTGNYIVKVCSLYGYKTNVYFPDTTIFQRVEQHDSLGPQGPPPAGSDYTWYGGIGKHYVMYPNGDRHNLDSTGGGGSPGGSSADIQYNDAGAFAGDDRLTFDAASGLTTAYTVRMNKYRAVVDSTPATIGSNQDNYDIGGAGILRLATTSGSITVSGFTNGVRGRLLLMINIGSTNLTLKNEGTGSSASNRITTGTSADVVVDANRAVELWYDSTSSRWRISASTYGVPLNGGSANQVYRKDNFNFPGWGSMDLGASAAVGTSVLHEANGGTNQTSYITNSVIFNTSSTFSSTLNFRWDPTYEAIVIGGGTSITSMGKHGMLMVGDNSSAGQLMLWSARTSGTVNEFPIMLRGSSGTLGSPGLPGNGLELGATIYAAFNSGSAWSNVAQVVAIADSQNTTTSQPSAFQWSVTDVGSTTMSAQMKLNRHGFLGIGNTSPAERLDVTGNAKVSGTLSINGAKITVGTGSPESAVVGNVGDLFLRTDGGASTTLYVKESGTGNTGWVGK